LPQTLHHLLPIFADRSSRRSNKDFGSAVAFPANLSKISCDEIGFAARDGDRCDVDCNEMCYYFYPETLPRRFARDDAMTSTARAPATSTEVSIYFSRAARLHITNFSLSDADAFR
jgi:hypothetical protein